MIVPNGGGSITSRGGGDMSEYASSSAKYSSAMTNSGKEIISGNSKLGISSTSTSAIQRGEDKAKELLRQLFPGWF